VLARKAGSAPARAAAPAAANGASSNGAAAKPEGAQLIKGSAAVLARYMDESRSIPTATSFRTITVTAMDTRRKQLKAGGQKVSFTHLIAYAIALAVQQDMPSMAKHFAELDGKPHVIDDDAVHLGIAVDVTTKKGRTLMVPVIKDAGRRSFADFKAAFDDLIARARENKLTAEDLQGANVSLTNPGGIGTVASGPAAHDGPGHDHRHGLHRLSRRPRRDRRHDRRREGHDHDLDVRPPDHPGRESGQFLKVVEDFLQGENGFYEGVFSSLGRRARPRAAGPAPGRGRRRARDAPRPRPGRHGHAAERGAPAGRAGRGLPAQGAPHPRPPRRAAGSRWAPSPRATPRWTPSRSASRPELMAQIPAKILRMHVPGATLADALPHLRETYCGTIAYEIEHISSHRQRTWLRERIEAARFRTALTNDENKALLKRLSRSTRSSASCTRPTSARSSSPSRAWT
jgi:2-oxoglutarate dehydrogenase E1 component